MRSRCPYCQDGCDKCEWGFIRLEICPEYAYLICNICERCVGGRAYGEGFPPLPEKPDPLVMCPSCDTNDLRYEV